MDPASRHSVYRLMMVVTLAAVAARIAGAERTNEPSIHRPDPRLAALALAPLGASGPLEVVAPAAGVRPILAEQERFGPTRAWPVARPHPMPTFSSNDKSRWATVRALVEDRTWVIGRRVTMDDGRFRDVGRAFDPGYESVDKVLHPDTMQFYSSKPPLLTLITAVEYETLYRLGLTLERDRWLVVRLIVASQNLLSIAAILLGLVAVLERYGQSDWGRLLVYAGACFGTFLTTFAISLNNHVPAAALAFFAVRPLLMCDHPGWGVIARSGLLAGLAVALELPAAALLAGLFLAWLIIHPRAAIVAFLPLAALPIVAQVGLNYAAIGEVAPIYSKFGGPWYEYPGSHWTKKPGELKRGIDWAKDYESRPVYAMHLLIGHHGIFSLTPLWLLSVGAMLRRWQRTRFDGVLALIGIVSVVVIGFYCGVVGTANYGGWTSGARWFFWLAPLWLVAALPVADRLAATRLGRGVGLTLLALSVFSASYSLANPWRHPWLYVWLENSGLIPYGR